MKVYVVQVKRHDGTMSKLYMFDTLENAFNAVEQYTGAEFSGFYGEGCIWEPLENGDAVIIWFPEMNKPIKF